MQKTVETALFDRFAESIANLPTCTKTELLTSRFLLEREGTVEIYYAPLDHVNPNAKVAIVGITPGWPTMQTAFQVARGALREGEPRVNVLERAKYAAVFASMRKNLIQMLDGIGLQEGLEIGSCASIFGNDRQLLHATSAIRYPVFVDGQRYTGHSPKLEKSGLLQRYVREVLRDELHVVSRALIIPLGKAVDSALQSLLPGVVNRCLIGFPHPSPANGHRRIQFERNRNELAEKVSRWFTRCQARNSSGKERGEVPRSLT